VWNTKTGQTIVELRARTGQFDSKGRVSSAAFSPDGKFVLTAIADGTAYVYGCEICASLEDLLAIARTRVTRELTSEERKTYLHE
jgi:WD40 repeat protein